MRSDRSFQARHQGRFDKILKKVRFARALGQYKAWSGQKSAVTVAWSKRPTTGGIPIAVADGILLQDLQAPVLGLAFPGNAQNKSFRVAMAGAVELPFLARQDHDGSVRVHPPPGPPVGHDAGERIQSFALERP